MTFLTASWILPFMLSSVSEDPRRACGSKQIKKKEEVKGLEGVQGGDQ